MQRAALSLAWIVCAAAAAGAADSSRIAKDAAAAFLPTKIEPAKEQSRPAEPQAKARADGQKRTDGPQGRVCFNAADTRDKIMAHRLTEPFRALRAGRLQGEALRARLCRWKQDEFIYEISVLRRDGRIVHIYMNAANGQDVGIFGNGDRK